MVGAGGGEDGGGEGDGGCGWGAADERGWGDGGAVAFGGAEEVEG